MKNNIAESYFIYFLGGGWQQCASTHFSRNHRRKNAESSETGLLCSKAQIEPDPCPDGLLAQSVACNSWDCDIIFFIDNIYRIIPFTSYLFWHPAPWASVLSPLVLSHSSPVSASCWQCRPWLHYKRSDYRTHSSLTEHEFLEKEVDLGYLIGKKEEFHKTE